MKYEIANHSLIQMNKDHFEWKENRIKRLLPYHIECENNPSYNRNFHGFGNNYLAVFRTFM